jgi:hypothetical protein
MIDVYDTYWHRGHKDWIVVKSGNEEKTSWRD